jgi:catechol 2,3-dioxygenase-like lactoylglutathione lyase family enzyme
MSARDKATATKDLGKPGTSRASGPLNDADAAATIAVKDIERATSFYEGKLGFSPMPSDEPSVRSYRSGRSSVLVYQSTYAGTNRATAATWAVRDVDGTVASLKARGITFEHYDLPDATWEGDVMVSGRIRSAWFKDPDGNVLAIVNA